MQNGVVLRDLDAEIAHAQASLGIQQAEWDFWLRCASKGRWGSTVKEFLVWRQPEPDTNEWLPVAALPRGLEQDLRMHRPRL